MLYVSDRTNYSNRISFEIRNTTTIVINGETVKYTHVVTVYTDGFVEVVSFLGCNMPVRTILN